MKDSHFFELSGIFRTKYDKDNKKDEEQIKLAILSKLESAFHDLELAGILESNSPFAGPGWMFSFEEYENPYFNGGKRIKVKN